MVTTEQNMVEVRLDNGTVIDRISMTLAERAVFLGWFEWRHDGAERYIIARENPSELAGMTGAIN